MGALHKIEELVSQLDYSWYNQKKYFFEKETFYIPKYGKICEEMPDYRQDWDEENQCSIERPNIVIDIDFKEYCWSSYYPGCLNGSEYTIETLPIDSGNVCASVLAEVKELVNELRTDDLRHNVLMIARDTLIDNIEQLQALQADDTEYKDILSHFLHEARMAIHKEFRAFKEAYFASKDYKHKLVFNLNQDELAALLNILFKAEFFYQSDVADNMFLDFARKHFHFPNQRQKGKITLARGLDKKFREAQGIDYSIKARQTVIDRLKKAIKDL
jgi:hypothetical protein